MQGWYFFLDIGKGSIYKNPFLFLFFIWLLFHSLFFFFFFFFFFFNNLECPGQFTCTLTNPTGSVHCTIGSFSIRIRVNRWLFTKECEPKELFTSKWCWTLDLYWITSNTLKYNNENYFIFRVSHPFKRVGAYNIASLVLIWIRYQKTMTE